MWYDHVSWRFVCRTSRSPCQSFREWFEAILVMLFLHVARGRPQIVSASGRPELRSGVRLFARLGPPQELWLSVVRTLYSAKVPPVILVIIELEQTCPNQ